MASPSITRIIKAKLMGRVKKGIKTPLGLYQSHPQIVFDHGAEDYTKNHRGPNEFRVEN